MKNPFPIQTIKNFFKLGASPSELAATSTAALVVGIMPFFGVTTLIMGVIAAKMKLSFPLMYALSYIVYPIQILLVIPFLRIGEWMTGTPQADLSFQEIKAAFQADFLGAIADFGVASLQAVAGWLLICLPITFLLHKFLTKTYAYFLEKKLLMQAESVQQTI